MEQLLLSNIHKWLISSVGLWYMFRSMDFVIFDSPLTTHEEQKSQQILYCRTAVNIWVLDGHPIIYNTYFVKNTVDTSGSETMFVKLLYHPFRKYPNFLHALCSWPWSPRTFCPSRTILWTTGPHFLWFLYFVSLQNFTVTLWETFLAVNLIV